MSVCLFVCLSVCQYVSLPVCLSTSLSIFLSVCLSVCPHSSAQLATSRRTCSGNALHCIALASNCSVEKCFDKCCVALAFAEHTVLQVVVQCSAQSVCAVKHMSGVCSALNYTAKHGTALNCTILHWIAMHHTTLICSALHCSSCMNVKILHGSVTNSAALSFMPITRLRMGNGGVKRSWSRKWVNRKIVKHLKSILRLS